MVGGIVSSLSSSRPVSFISFSALAATTCQMERLSISIMAFWKIALLVSLHVATIQEFWMVSSNPLVGDLHNYAISIRRKRSPDRLSRFILRCYKPCVHCCFCSQPRALYFSRSGFSAVHTNIPLLFASTIHFIPVCSAASKYCSMP